MRSRAARGKLPQESLAEASLAEASLAEADLAEAGLAEAGLAEASLAEAALAEAALAEAALAEAVLAEAATASVREGILSSNRKGEHTPRDPEGWTIAEKCAESPPSARGLPGAESTCPGTQKVRRCPPAPQSHGHSTPLSPCHE